MKKVIIIALSVFLCGCAGSSWIWEYDYNAEKKELVLKKVTHFEGRNIKCKTAEKGAEMETKNLELPSVPFVR